jgi:putative aldouronate transport system permease protein
MTIFFTNEHTTLKRILKGLLYISLIILLFELILVYLTNVEIDGAKDSLISTIKTCFMVNSIISPIALGYTIFFTIKYYIDKKELFKHRNKKKVKIYPFDVLNFVFLGIFCLLCIYPIIYVLVGSFSQGADYEKGGVYFIPRIFTFQNYSVVLEKPDLWSSYWVTIGRTVIGTLTALVFTSVVAYAMSRDLKGKKIFYWINIFTMFFGGGLVPYFLIIKSVGLYDNFLVYIIPSIYSVYNMIVISSFFKQISNEIHEAAIVDGANEFRIWWQIYMPLSGPVLATVALWLAVGHWNSYFDTMIYTSSKELHTLQYFLLEAIQTSTLTEGLPPTMMEKMTSKTISLAAIIISVIPVLMFFPFVRKNFQSGIMVGSLKG